MANYEICRSKPSYKGRQHDILYQNTPTSRLCLPVWGGLPKYLAEEMRSIQNKGLDIIGIPRTSLPTLEDRCNVATKRELERIVNHINHPNQIFLTKPNTIHGYNLRSKPGSVAMPRSGTQRHASSFIPRAARLLLWSVIFTYFFIRIITWYHFIVYVNQLYIFLKDG